MFLLTGEESLQTDGEGMYICIFMCSYSLNLVTTSESEMDKDGYGNDMGMSEIYFPMYICIPMD